MNRRELLISAAAAAVASGIRHASGASLPPFDPAPFVDHSLDQTPSLYALHGACLLIGNYYGPLYQVKNEATNEFRDIYAKRSKRFSFPDAAKLRAFANGAPLLVATVYDQTGNGRTLTQSTNAARCYLNLDTEFPLFDFDGTTSFLSGTTGLAAFAQNSTGVTIAAVYKHEVTSISDRQVAFVSNNSTSNRLGVGFVSATGTDAASGRRLDGDTLVRTVGVSPAAAWAVDVVRADFANGKLRRQRNGVDETAVSYISGSGSSSNTASNNVQVGASNGTASFNGKMAAVAWIGAALPDDQTATLTANLTPLSGLSVDSPNEFFKWGNTSQKGTYTLAPSKVDTTILTPSGATPTQADLTSHRYHHHTRVSCQPGRIWVACSSGLNNEDADGQMAVYFTSTDGGATWSAPAVAVPSQSDMGDTTNDANGRIVWPNSFQVYGGNLYLIAAISTGDGLITKGMVAVKCNTNGTVGTPFLITTAAYTPVSGYPAYSYDATLGPPLLALAKKSGIWGGSQPNQAASEFTGWISAGGIWFTEPVTVQIDNTGLNFVQMWRKITSDNRTTRWWARRSYDGGATWTGVTPTRIPNSPSAGTCMRLPDGRFAMVANPQDAATSRDPLYLALYDASGNQASIYAVRQGESATPTYPGTFKSGGAAYPGIDYDGTNLWVCYSLQKERVAITKIPLAGL